MRIVSLIEDKKIIKKILKHLDLWDVWRKAPARAHGPPTEAFIIFDESLSPRADDYVIDADYPIETYMKKNLVPGTPVNYTQICLNFQFHRKKLLLTTRPALVIQLAIVCVNVRFNMLGCS
jgi:hypothetical protein